MSKEKNMQILIRVGILILTFLISFSFTQDAKEIVEKANELIRAKSSYSEITMEVIKVIKYRHNNT